MIVLKPYMLVRNTVQLSPAPENAIMSHDIKTWWVLGGCSRDRGGAAAAAALLVNIFCDDPDLF